MPERYRFERELADLGLREADTSVPTRRVAVGERIVLDVKDTPYGGYEIVKVRWTTPRQVHHGIRGDPQAGGGHRPLIGGSRSEEGRVPLGRREEAAGGPREDHV